VTARPRCDLGRLSLPDHLRGPPGLRPIQCLPGVKRLEREAEPSVNAKIKNAWRFTPNALVQLLVTGTTLLCSRGSQGSDLAEAKRTTKTTRRSVGRGTICNGSLVFLTVSPQFPNRLFSVVILLNILGECADGIV
jgi:hypothetical protein